MQQTVPTIVDRRLQCRLKKINDPPAEEVVAAPIQVYDRDPEKLLVAYCTLNSTTAQNVKCIQIVCSTALILLSETCESEAKPSPVPRNISPDFQRWRAWGR